MGQRAGRRDGAAGGYKAQSMAVDLRLDWRRCSAGGTAGKRRVRFSCRRRQGLLECRVVCGWVFHQQHGGGFCLWGDAQQKGALSGLVDARRLRI